MKLELGSPIARDGWVSVDLSPRADVVADVLKLPFADGEVDAISAIDVLEHLSYRDTDAALAEWARVCAPGATIYVQVPDAETIMYWFTKSPHRLETWERGQSCTALHGAQWRLLGGHADGQYVDASGDWRWNAHYSLWSEESLRDAMQNAGFRFERPIDSNCHPNLLAHAVKA